MNPRQKVQVWIVSSDSQVLLLKTNAKRGSFWQPVTGSVEESEALEDAAAREAQEETGLSFEQGPQPLGFEFFFASKGERIQETVFWFKTPNAAQSTQIRLDPNEHESYRWMHPKDALKELQYESNAQALKILIKKLKRSQ